MPNAAVSEQFGAHIAYRLEVQDRDLASIFEQLETQGRRLGVAEYGLTQSTLEQVLLTAHTWRVEADARFDRSS